LPSQHGTQKETKERKKKKRGKKKKKKEREPRRQKDTTRTHYALEEKGDGGGRTFGRAGGRERLRRDKKK